MTAGAFILLLLLAALCATALIFLGLAIAFVRLVRLMQTVREVAARDGGEHL